MTNTQKWLNLLKEKPEEIHEREKVIKFVFLWMEYNYLYNRNSPTVNGDKKRALKLSDDQQAEKIYSSLKYDFVKKFKFIPSRYCNEGERDRLWSDSERQSEVVYEINNDNLKQFLTIIYQIRCNFLHGSKEGNDIDIALIIWAYDCFDVFLNKLQQQSPVLTIKSWQMDSA